MLAVIGISYDFESFSDEFHVYLTLDQFYINQSYRSNDGCFNAVFDDLSEQVAKALKSAQEVMTENQKLIVECVVPEQPELEDLLTAIVDNLNVV